MSDSSTKSNGNANPGAPAAADSVKIASPPVSQQDQTQRQRQSTNAIAASPPPIEQYFHAEYRHEMRPVPPYALEKLARCYYNKDRKEDDQMDPFLKTIDGDWRDFLHTIQQRPAYIQDEIQYEKYYDDKGAESISWNDLQADLGGEWGGDERLRKTFNNDTPDISPYDDYEKQKSDKKFWKPNGKDQEKDLNRAQHRTKAGYWMSTEKRGDLKSTAKRILLNNPYIPLFFRIFELVLSAVALSMAARIFVLSNRMYQETTVGQQPSTIMAIAVQTIALVYLLFIARDEFGGRPLGLRDPMAKLRLILLDLLFIIFSSANLSLTFNTLFDDRWVCVDGSAQNHLVVGPICRGQKGLAALIFVMLCMWVVTFTISLLRVVEKVSTPVAPFSAHR